MGEALDLEEEILGAYKLQLIFIEAMKSTF